MKLARIGVPGAEALAALDTAGDYRDISSAFADLTVDFLVEPAPLQALALGV